MARPVALDVGDVSSAPESGSTGRTGLGGGSGPGLSPSTEKRAKMMDRGSTDGSQGSEKENFDRQKGSFSRAGSLQGKELKRQFSMSDAMNRGHDSQGGSGGLVGGSGGGASQTSAGMSQAGAEPAAPGQERGRGKERGQSKHRFYSESRLPETDRRYGGGDSSSSHAQQEQQQQLQQQQQQLEHARDRHKGDTGSRHEMAPGTSSSSGKQDHGNYRSEAEMRDAERKERHR
ncbi:hypothetical protein ElyMa_004116900 [Elysia marginata]|uniref:Uncharacterized protein n=1 Tax=Elysia marginata TaxID=1093978 RepID=A0AAV4GDL2_9GAST|nr:hypothetical protein ElyMa_004116900 [Elysia marginata]